MTVVGHNGLEEILLIQNEGNTGSFKYFYIKKSLFLLGFLLHTLPHTTKFSLRQLYSWYFKAVFSQNSRWRLAGRLIFLNFAILFVNT